MNRDELRQKAATRRTGEEVAAPTAGKWVCTYCSRPFVYEKAFMDHRCREKLKLDQLRSPLGQAAYAHYSEWMRAQRHSVPPIETFAESRLYSTFIKFAEYAEKTKLPNVNEFIRAMVAAEPKVSPGLWCKDSVYSAYLQGYDAVVPPAKQFVDSADVISDLAVELKTAPKDVFSAIGVETLVSLIQKRKLSHWFLLASDAFKSYLKGLPPEQRDQVSRALNINAAIVRIRQEQVLFKEFGRGARELGL